MQKPDGCYIAIRHSEALGRDINTFVHNMDSGTSVSQTALLASIMERFLDEAIDALLVAGCDAVHLQGMPRKAVDITTRTVRGTCHLLSRRVLRKMQNQEVAALAAHMDDLRACGLDEHGVTVSATVIPIDDGLKGDIENLMSVVTVDASVAYAKPFESILFRFLDLCIEYLYVRTLATLKLGPVARKMVNVGYDTVHGGTHRLIHRVLPHLSDEQLYNAVSFTHSLMLDIRDQRLYFRAKTRASDMENCQSNPTCDGA